MKKLLLLLTSVSLLAAGCNQSGKSSTEQASSKPSIDSAMMAKVAQYDTVKLTADISKLSDDQKKIISKLIEAGKIMDNLYWYQTYGNKDSLLNSISDPYTKRYVEINYGPWDRLADNKPFVKGVGPKPLGANFYPVDMTKAEFDSANIPDKTSQYNFIRRDKNGKLFAIPYHEMFSAQLAKASDLLKQCANLATDPDLQKYLNLRAQALVTDNYRPSDMAWMDMKNNMIDVVIGPIENYEDRLYNYKASYETYVLLKDTAWSKRLAKYASFLPALQKGLPVPDKYKQEKPGTDADLNAYDVLYYAGDCNAGSKTIAINLPNDEKVQLEKGSRRLQLKNAMRAKFDRIMIPIAKELITPDQLKHVTFDAFFSNTMFHEVAHGLGIKNTINGKGTVRSALKEHFSAIEEGKADILGLYMITQLINQGELKGPVDDYYVTFLAGIFRSVRFGATEAHGQANMIRFNFFKERGAFSRDENGKYRVDIDKMKEAMTALSDTLLTLQGNGDYEGVSSLVSRMAVVHPQLQKDLQRLDDNHIPVDIVFQQGNQVLGLPSETE